MPRRQTERLHLGRRSAAGARYFVTFVTHARVPWLGTPPARQAMLEALLAWHGENDGQLIAATVMPDHVHVLLQLGVRLAVGRCVSRWKAQTQRAGGYVGNWQRDFWEHLIGEEEKLEDYGLYLLLNPYREGLIDADESWPGWCCPSPGWFRFTATLSHDGIPPREWLGWPADRFAALATGES